MDEFKFNGEPNEEESYTPKSEETDFGSEEFEEVIDVAPEELKPVSHERETPKAEEPAPDISEAETKESEEPEPIKAEEAEQVKAEKAETAKTEETDGSPVYNLRGTDLGDSAKETFSAPKKTESAETAPEQPRVEQTTYQSSPYSNTAYNAGYNYAQNAGKTDVPYSEHINRKKKKHKKSGEGKRPMRYVAALLAAAMLNLAVLGAAFALGHSMGKTDAKNSLSQNIKAEETLASTAGTSDTNGITKTAAADGSKETTEIAKEVGPAVVGIKSTIEGQMSLFGGRNTSEGQGSGIIISSDGYIITNNHVVEDASSVVVQLNTGSEYDAEIIGTDEQTDLAVIKITPSEELTVATLGDSNTVEVGETAIAIGNPMGLEFFGSVTQGIVSAVNRSITVDDRTMNLIQTDAAINSGNSGGALVNSRGEVIGINTVKVSTTGVEGMGFAIPISEAKPIISDLLDYGYVKGRPIIGIGTRDVSQYNAMRYGWPQGAQILEVYSEAASKAGLQQGDIITKIDGNEVKSGADLTSYKDTKSPGDTVTLEVYKYATGTTVSIQLVLSEQTPD